MAHMGSCFKRQYPFRFLGSGVFFFFFFFFFFFYFFHFGSCNHRYLLPETSKFRIRFAVRSAERGRNLCVRWPNRWRNADGILITKNEILFSYLVRSSDQGYVIEDDQGNLVADLVAGDIPTTQGVLHVIDRPIIVEHARYWMQRVIDTPSNFCFSRFFKCLVNFGLLSKLT